MKEERKTFLQVALDLTNLGKALKIASISAELGVDIIEAGTPLIKKYGMIAVEAIKEISENSLVVADLKTLDTGYLEAKIAFESGADVVTVSGLAPIETINSALKAADEYNKMVCVDLLGVTNLRDRLEELLKFNDINFYLIHLGIDQQKEKHLLLEKLNSAVNLIDKSKLAVAGGINLDTIKTILSFDPKIIIVGSAIYQSNNPRKAIIEFLKIINEK